MYTQMMSEQNGRSALKQMMLEQQKVHSSTARGLATTEVTQMSSTINSKRRRLDYI